MQAIDTHAHFWDTATLAYPWIESGSVFDRAFTLSDYCAASHDAPIGRIVFVEADAASSCSLREAEWVQQLSVEDPRIQGVVARVQLTGNPSVLRDLDMLCRLPLLRGIRDNIQNHSVGFALQDTFVDGVKEVHRRGLHFELCLRHHQLAETIELVRKCPEGWFVLDHCAKPDIRQGVRQPWLQQLRELAALPNVVCKISGLVTEADWANWRPEQILWYARRAALAFGPERIMFGSDWPVNEVAGGFMKWFQIAESLCADWSQDNQESFFSGNAMRIYRLDAES